MEHRGGLRIVIMEDVGVVMDQRGVGNHVRLLLSSSFPSSTSPFCHLDSPAYQGQKTNHLQPKERRRRHMLMSSGRMPMPPRRGECTP
jgi:hypothetical protein